MSTRSLNAELMPGLEDLRSPWRATAHDVDAAASDPGDDAVANEDAAAGQNGGLEDVVVAGDLGDAVAAHGDVAAAAHGDVAAAAHGDVAAAAHGDVAAAAHGDVAAAAHEDVTDIRLRTILRGMRLNQVNARLKGKVVRFNDGYECTVLSVTAGPDPMGRILGDFHFHLQVVLSMSKDWEADERMRVYSGLYILNAELME
jgi:hypothetical protein